MEMNRKDFSVSQIIKLTKNQMLKANSEYQRGIVWNIIRKQKLVDSVMRGYPLPLIYLHHIQRKVENMQRDDLEIIDGQQRIKALYDFSEGAYKCLDPVKDDAVAKFPKFLKDQPCPWAGKDFRSLSKNLQDKFLNTTLSVAEIGVAEDNEVRDLFVRLQSGLPLNAQETRDALPGQFTDFILRLGGKPAIARYPGHELFRKVMGLHPDKDRGKTRQIAAQVAMLYFGRREHGLDFYSDIGSIAIDDFYYSHIDFDEESSDAKRLSSILDKLLQLLGDGKRPKLKAHDVIHLALMVDALWDDYTRSWEGTLPGAVDKFLKAVAHANKTKDSAQPDEFWLKYGVWTRSNSDKRDTIRQRHEFYLSKFFGNLGSLTVKDPKRSYGALEREIIYFRDSKKCDICKKDVLWEEAEIHHTRAHSKGGRTVLTNGVLVHRHCHPKGSAANAFETKRSPNKERATKPRRSQSRGATTVRVRGGEPGRRTTR